MTNELKDIKDLADEVLKAPLKFINYHNDTIVSQFEVGGVNVELKNIEEFHQKLGLKHEQVSFYTLGMKITKPDLNEDDIDTLNKQENPHPLPNVNPNPIQQPNIKPPKKKDFKEADESVGNTEKFKTVLEKMGQILIIRGYKKMSDCCKDKGEEGLRLILAGRELLETLNEYK